MSGNAAAGTSVPGGPADRIHGAAKKVGNERRIPFEVAADTFYSESNIRVLEERAANIESGRFIPKEHGLIEV